MPKYQSHYSRNENPDRVYLNYDLTINSLYSNYYINWCNEEGKNIVSSDKFRRIFCEDFNIGFKLPKSDTCATCDSLNMQINSMAPDDEGLEILQNERKIHVENAEMAQDTIKQLASLASKDPAKYHVIALDLQQVLPTPKLTVSHAFYKRKLSTYNLGIHDLGTNRGYMFVWNESIAERGSDEIASCLLKYLQCQNISSEELHIISDNCKGQNKNWTFIGVYNALSRSGIVKKIYHHFPVVGHTYLPCDRDFGRIELYVRKHMPLIYTTEEWAECILQSNKKNKFHVTLMNSADFKDFTCFSNHVTKKNKTDAGEPLKFSEASVFYISAADPFILFISHNYDFENVNYKSCTIRKRGRTNSALNPFQAPRKYSDCIPIEKNKWKDLQSLLNYIPQQHHTFFNNIVAGNVDGEIVDLVD